jgi:hypothetical protein
LQIIQRRWGSSDRAATSTPSSHGWSRSTGIGGRVQLECLVAFAWNRWSQSTGTRNPQASNLFAVLGHLQKDGGFHLEVRAEQ